MPTISSRTFPRRVLTRRPLLTAAGLTVAAALIAAVPATAQAAPAPAGAGSFAVTKVYTGIDTPGLNPSATAPSSFYVDAHAGRMYVAEKDDVAVVDLANGQILNRVPINLSYGSLAFDEEFDTLVVFQRDSSAIVRIDRSTLTITSIVTSSDPIVGGNIAINNSTGSAYYTGNVDGSFVLGKTVGAGDLDRVYVPYTVQAETFQFPQPAIDEASGLVYVVGRANKGVTVVNGDSLTINREIPTALAYNSIAFDPISKRLYASDDDLGGGTLVTIDATTGTVSPPVTIDPAGIGTVTVDPATGRVLVATGTDDAPGVAWFDPDTQTVVQNLPVPATINAFYWDGTGAVYGNTTDQSIVRLDFGIAPTIDSPASVATATVGTAYSTTVTAEGTGPISFSITAGSLPDGLTLDPATGVISGTPTTVGTATFTITATNEFGVDTQEVGIQTLLAPAPVPVPTPTQTATLIPTPTTLIPTGTTLIPTGTTTTTLASTGAEPLIPVGIAGLALLAGAAALVLRRTTRRAR